MGGGECGVFGEVFITHYGECGKYRSNSARMSSNLPLNCPPTVVGLTIGGFSVALENILVDTRLETRAGVRKASVLAIMAKRTTTTLIKTL